MSRLTVYPDTSADAPILDTCDAAEIAKTLAKIDVQFERWPAEAVLAADADDAAVMAAYAGAIDRLKAEGGYQAVDVVRMAPDNPQKEMLRRKFLSEHRHAEDEVRFFVEGEGLFCLREAGKVHMVLCEAGDLISVPAGIRHWFDMGPAPRFTAIRLFTNPEGWVAQYTDDPIADAYPRLEPQKLDHMTA
ncbi:1,2-dihydroxy-3-keto-5-methylthiopentene dioxygenase [Phenylobacterium montanum]|uniref:Acireductone dioxygenase n=1 Tax=Phenylobacterium montanum TaxID=2823693 RepID=A0A975G1P1_9CAUL|nr:cupin domain-containing protein [Caulobacter sp. S6]QUD88361.1 cupin domain-containing protein [Caulobacter sp. S6]